jgi:hypothetical protein
MTGSTPNLNQIAVNQTISRYSFLIVLRSALEAKTFRFARQISQDWVKIYPGDLEVNFLLSKALLGEGDKKQAVEILKTICRRDPEYYEAMETLALALAGTAEPALEPLVALFALAGLPKPPVSMPKWGLEFATAWKTFKEGKLDEALTQAAVLVQAHPDFLLAAVLHLRILDAKSDEVSVIQLGNSYHNKWTDCVTLSLLLAECKMKMGQETEAVGLLHQCVANDAAGQVAQRAWGAEHFYSPLWVDSFDFRFAYAVPASVAQLFGWNQLPTGQISATPSGMETQPEVTFSKTASVAQEPTVVEATADGTISESLRSVEDAFNTIANRFSGATFNREEGRFPMYVIMTCRGGLVKQYGQQTALIIESSMKQLAGAVANRKGWGGMVFIADDPNVRTELGISPVDAIDPWKIKLALKDLDTALARKGEMIGVLVIVGGPEVVPFHKLPNPTDDDDKEVPSDNPYATLDSNYFVPGWPVGRLPGETGQDAALLMGQIHRLIDYHTQLQRLTSAPTWVEIFFRLLDRFRFSMKKVRKTRVANFGITAAVWRKASVNVFNAIGASGDMLISPPDQAGTYPATRVADAALAYTNLHGTQDGPDWYGQRDAQESPTGPDYPIAINPSILQSTGHAPQFVFSEACYGAYIINKKEDESMALKFMGVGSQAMVGSTTIAYGSVDAPLIGADLLGSFYWKALKEGSTAGEAFMRAKIGLAQEMAKRQGFLDGEDQKTLISFVLYGDPLVALDSGQKLKKSYRALKQLPFRVVSDHKTDEMPVREVSQAVLKQMKELVAPYLPGLEDIHVVISSQYDPQAAPVDEQVLEADSKVKKTADGHVVITFSKSVRTTTRIHRHYARATVSPEGKLVKLAVSR